MNLCSSLPVTTQEHNGSPYLDLIRYHYNLGLSKVMPGIKHPEEGLLTIYLLRGCIKGYWNEILLLLLLIWIKLRDKRRRE